MKEPRIRVGLITRGRPEISDSGDHHIVSNLLIGEGFHWEKTIPVKVKGDIELLDSPQGNIHCINSIGIEDYLAAVIGSEMNSAAPTALRQAHAVISRSWALLRLNRPVCEAPHFAPDGNRYISWEEAEGHTGFDVCSDDHCQRYQGFNENSEQLCRGMVLTTPDGRVVDTRFSKCCGGRTEVFGSCWAEDDHDYLKSFDDPWCDLTDMTPDERHRFLGACLKDYDNDDNYLTWQEHVDAAQLSERIRTRYGVDLGSVRNLRPVRWGESGRITELEIEGEHGNIVVGKTLAIRRLLSAGCLRSSWFEIGRSEGGFSLSGRGWGHGVGLCQIGAARMAWEGADFREILKHYYPNTAITLMYE